jgi:hypothetical protein
VLKYPETGIHARELLVRYRSLSREGFIDAFEAASGKLANDFNRFLANTPCLEAVRCIGNQESGKLKKRIITWLPIQFFASLSSLASLRYLYLGDFEMNFKESTTSLPPLHQVRILRYSQSTGPMILGDLLRYCMPNIHTLYVTFSVGKYQKDLDRFLDGIKVRCRF